MGTRQKSIEKLVNKEIEILLDTTYSGFKGAARIAGIVKSVQSSGQSAQVELMETAEVNKVKVRNIQVRPRYEHDTILRLNSFLPWLRSLVVNVLSVSPEGKVSFMAIGKLSVKKTRRRVE